MTRKCLSRKLHYKSLIRRFWKVGILLIICTMIVFPKLPNITANYLFTKLNKQPHVNEIDSIPNNIILPNGDSDGDGISDDDEINIYGTDPHNPDTDSDGLSDYFEINYFELVPEIDFKNFYLFLDEEPISTKNDSNINFTYTGGGLGDIVYEQYQLDFPTIFNDFDFSLTLDWEANLYNHYSFYLDVGYYNSTSGNFTYNSRVGIYDPWSSHSGKFWTNHNASNGVWHGDYDIVQQLRDDVIFRNRRVDDQLILTIIDEETVLINHSYYETGGLINSIQLNFHHNPLYISGSTEVYCKSFSGLIPGTHYLNPLSNDTDADNITDIDEIFIYLTDPFKPDTDYDGYSDYTEIQAGTDPTDPEDYPQETTPPSTTPTPTIEVSMYRNIFGISFLFLVGITLVVFLTQRKKK